MIFSEYEVKDLPLTHPIFHSYFDLDQVVQVPGVAALIHGVTYEKGGVTPHYMGVEDKNGRLMIFLTRNCDLGDAWEWINEKSLPGAVWPGGLQDRHQRRDLRHESLVTRCELQQDAAYWLSQDIIGPYQVPRNDRRSSLKWDRSASVFSIGPLEVNSTMLTEPTGQASR